MNAKWSDWNSTNPEAQTSIPFLRPADELEEEEQEAVSA
jgi:hypothetical protein